MTDVADEPLPSPRVVSLTSAKQMRALAHPLRMRILGELRTNGPRTVGGLCDVVDEAPGTLSYHLGKLAEFGFVEEAPELSRDRREHWWRSAHEWTNISSATSGDQPDERRASAALRHQIVDIYSATLHAAIDAGEQDSREWAAASTSSDTVAFLTVEELAEASAELDQLVLKWHDIGARSPGEAGADGAESEGTGRDGTRAVQLIVHAILRP